MHPYQAHYSSIVPKLHEASSYASPYLVPRLQKVVVNVGVGDCINDSKALDAVVAMLTQIAGQKPVQIKARKAIAGFKIRENMVVGLKVTLRGSRMQDFVYKLMQVVLPRTRDFRGIPETGITADGNLNIGIKDSMIFPEVSHLGSSHGIQITLVSNAKNLEITRHFYQSLGFVFGQKVTENRKSKRR
jgi:large subunit ribosomal protein L5